MSDADAFLTPTVDVFQVRTISSFLCLPSTNDVFKFFEDGSTVKLGFLLGLAAMDPARNADVGRFMKIMVILSFVFGIPASAISTGVAFIRPAVEFFVPLSESATIPLDCPLFPDLESGAHDVVSLVRPYWLLVS